MKDALRFVPAFRDPIAQSVPHIYLSALPFAPEQSRMAQDFLHNYPRTITVATGRSAYWSPILFVTEHHRRVGAVAFSPDQRYLASCGDDGIMNICDVENGSIISGPFEEQSGSVNSIAFHRNGHRVASGSQAGMVRVWDIKSGDELLCVHEPEGGHLWVAFSNDGKTIASYSLYGVITIWDAESGLPLKSWNAESNLLGVDRKRVRYRGGGQAVVKFSVGDQSVISVTCAGSGYVGIWNVHDGTHEKLFSLGVDNLSAVALSPDGRLIAGGLINGAVRIWPIETVNPSINPEPLEKHGGRVYSLAFSTNGKRLASASWSGTVTVREISTNQMVFMARSVRGSTAALSADGTRLAMGSLEDGTVRTWVLNDAGVSSLSGLTDVPDSRNRDESTSRVQEEDSLLPTIPKEIYGISFSPCGERLVSRSRDGLRVWDANTGELLLEPIKESSVIDVLFSPGGEWIISLSKDGSICKWDMTGKLVFGSSERGGNILWKRLAFLPNSKKMVASASDRVCIWDLGAMEVPMQNILRDASDLSVLSPDGTKIIWGNSELGIRMLSTETRILIPVHFEGLQSLRRTLFSPSGKLLLSFPDNILKVWDVETGEEVASGSFGKINPFSQAISPDDRFITMGDRDGKILVFDIAHSRICGVWPGHVSRVDDITFSLDGKRMGSCSRDRTIRIWDTSDFASSTSGHPLRERYDPYTDECTLENGWVKTATGELLFWVPPSNREGLWRARNMAVIGEVTTRLDLTKFEYGNDWQKCRDST